MPPHAVSFALTLPGRSPGRRDKKVTPGQDAVVSLEDLVRTELLVVRRSAGGLTLASMTTCSTITALLGGGDPGLAYNQLKTLLLDEDYGLEVLAATASLGLTSDQNTHLGRLEAFGSEWGYDQRQVRRYSDRGIREIASLITTRWVEGGVPELNVTVLPDRQGILEIHLSTRRLAVIAMRHPVVRVRTGDVEETLALSLRSGETDGIIQEHMSEPFLLAPSEKDTSVTIVWPGELWPKYTVVVAAAQQPLVVESLGAKLMLRF